MPRTPKLDAIQKREQALRDRIAKMRQDLQKAEAAERQEQKRQYRNTLWSIAKTYEHAGCLDLKLEQDPDVLLGAFVHLASQANDAECRARWADLGRQHRVLQEPEETICVDLS
jgi:hypothetical protein